MAHPPIDAMAHLVTAITEARERVIVADRDAAAARAAVEALEGYYRRVMEALQAAEQAAQTQPPDTEGGA